MKNIHKINGNIYITNDEEIKDVEYGICLNLVREGFKSHQAVFEMDLEQRQAMEDLGGQKKAEVLKIVLTTDQDLIKSGVQAIDDEFLEWFVKNPSCEEVMVDKFISEIYFCTNPMIPKEEPKQKWDIDTCRYFDMEVGCEREKCICENIPKEEPKKETLEEASFRFYPEDEQWTDRHIFTLGAKWQQQQNKNLYSEQTVTEYAYYFESCYAKRPMQTPLTPSKWFEQFKNK